MNYDKVADLHKVAIDDYLKSFEEFDETESFDDKKARVFDIMQRCRADFHKKYPSFLKNRRQFPNAYEENFEKYLDAVEESKGFYGFEQENFLPALAPLAGKIAKGGFKLIKDKLSKAKAGKPDTTKSEGLVADTARTNIALSGADVWLTKQKQKSIDNLIAAQKKQEFQNNVRAEIMRAGLLPKTFKHFEDENGNYSYDAVEKIKEVIKKTVGEYKEAETAKEKNKVMPFIFIGLVLAFYLGTKS
ncbi:MAG: hypothetical protein ACRCZ9_03140 [Fusobacteriaceae bacterium]